MVACVDHGMIRPEGRSRRGPQMSATPEGTLADLEQTIADLRGELARRTAELAEALQRETATAEVLQVINSSPGDLAPVFDAMLEKAMRLCDASFGLLNTYDGEQFHPAALRGVPDALAELWKSTPPRPGSHNALTRAINGEDVVEIADLAAYPSYLTGDLRTRGIVELGGARSYALVALRKDGKLLGTISIYRQE